jgi:hypothetical protein
MRARQRHFNARDAGANMVFDARFIPQANETEVTSWPNRSTGDAATQVSGSTPAFFFEGWNNFNTTLPCVECSAGAGALASNASFSGSQSRVIIATYFQYNTGVSRTVAGQSGTSTTGAYFVMQCRTNSGSTGDPYILCVSTNTQAAKSTSNTTAKIGTGAYDGTTLYTRKDGAQIDSVARTLNTNNTNFRLGHTITGTTLGSGFQGAIGCVIAGPLAYSVPVIRRLEHHVAFSYKLPCS